MDEMRLREIAEQAISYLQDNGLLMDFLTDRCIELSEKEMEYFEIEYDEIDLPMF